MSAAESARPGPDHGPMAAVIPFIDPARRPRRPSSERTTVPPQPDGSLSPEQRLAASIEYLFGQNGLSLTDDDSALAYRLTIGAVRKMVEGLCVNGRLGDEEYRDLDDMLKGMLAAAAALS